MKPRPILPYFPLVTGLRDFFRRLTRPPDDIREEHLRQWASSVSGTTSIVGVEPRHRTKVAGVIQNLRIDPREGHGSIEATIIDGTGDMVVKWLGRPSVSGIRLGMGLIVEGTPGRDPNGDLVILNPEYQLVPGPEHG
jgi:hypothetical protein